MEFQLGETYHGYQFLDVLKRSGNGIEFRVQNTMVGRLEVLRALAERAQDDQEQSERFAREMRVHAGLLHPNIVTLFNAVELGNHLVVTTELVEGPTLADKLLAGPLASTEAVALIRQVLSALGYAHTQGIVHRDISPENIVIGSGGVAKLANFGWAKGASSPKLTHVGVALGNLKYTSPEQVKGMGDVDARSDLYSLGMVLYELLCGQPAFQLESQFELMMAHVSALPPPPNSVKAGVPDALAAVVLKALAKDPAERYQTAAEFDEALAAVSEPTVELHEVNVVESVGAVGEAMPAAESAAVEAAPPAEETTPAAELVSAEAARDVVETTPPAESVGAEAAPAAVEAAPAPESVSAEAASAVVETTPPAESVGVETVPAAVEAASAPESVSAEAARDVVETTPAAESVNAGSASAAGETTPEAESVGVEAGPAAVETPAPAAVETTPETESVGVEAVPAAVETPAAESVNAESPAAVETTPETESVGVEAGPAAVETPAAESVNAESAPAAVETTPEAESVGVEAVPAAVETTQAEESVNAGSALDVAVASAEAAAEAPAKVATVENAEAAAETTPATAIGSGEVRVTDISVEAAPAARIESVETASAAESSLPAASADISESAGAAVEIAPAAESMSVKAALTAAVESVHAALEAVLAAESLEAESAPVEESASGKVAGSPAIPAGADSMDQWQAPLESLPAPLIEWLPRADPTAAKATADVVALSTSVEAPAEAIAIEIRTSAEPAPATAPRDVPPERAAPVPVSAPPPTDMSALLAAAGNPPLSRVQVIVGSAAGACLGILLVVLWIFVK